jgi:hypothetical protein
LKKDLRVVGDSSPSSLQMSLGVKFKRSALAFSLAPIPMCRNIIDANIVVNCIYAEVSPWNP